VATIDDIAGKPIRFASGVTTVAKTPLIHAVDPVTGEPYTFPENTKPEIARRVMEKRKQSAPKTRLTTPDPNLTEAQQAALLAIGRAGGPPVSGKSIEDLLEEENFNVQYANLDQGARPEIRAKVQGSAPENKLAVLQSFQTNAGMEPDARQVSEDNYVFTDPDTQRLTLFNPKSWEVGDFMRPTMAAEFVGSVAGAATALGATWYTGLGAIPSVMLGSGVGGAATKDAMQRAILKSQGVGEGRTPVQQLSDTALSAGINMMAPGIGAGTQKAASETLRSAALSGNRQIMRQNLEDAARILDPPAEELAPRGLPSAALPGQPTQKRLGMTPIGEADAPPFSIRGTTAGKRIATEHPTITLAQASSSDLANLAQRWVSSFPGGIGKMKRAAEAQLIAIQKSIDEKVLKLTRTVQVTAVTAGEAGMAAVQRAGTHRQFRSRANYNRLNKLIPEERKASASGFVNELKELVNPVKDLPSVGVSLTPANLTRLHKDLMKDLGEKDAAVLDLIEQVFGKQAAPAQPSIGALPDIGHNQLTDPINFGSLMRIRQMIGENLTSMKLPHSGDIPEIVYSRLYKALTGDIRKVAQQADMEAGLAGLRARGRRYKPGTGELRQAAPIKEGELYPELPPPGTGAPTPGTATKTFDVANNYHRQSKKVVDDILKPLIKSGVPERVFQAIEKAAVEGTTTLKELRRGATQQEWRMIVGAYIKKMGRPPPGKIGADVTGEPRFSFNEFLRNWDSLGGGDVGTATAPGLNRQVKDILFSGEGMSGIRADMDALARTSQRTQFSASTFESLPTGQGMMAGQGGLFMAGLAGVTGIGGAAVGIFPAGAALGGASLIMFLPIMMAGTRGIAHLLTDRRFVEWAANTAKMKPGGWGAQTGRLAGIAADSSPEVRGAIQEFLVSFTEIAEHAEAGTLSQYTTAAVSDQPTPQEKGAYEDISTLGVLDATRGMGMQ
jgi:hypothetical protein